MKGAKGAAVAAAIFLATSSVSAAYAARTPRGMHLLPPRSVPGATHQSLPWVEGVTPPLENRLFDDTYKVLHTHNVLKVYVFDAGGYESAGIRFSARVPHTARDLTADELEAEAVRLIRTTFTDFPEIQQLDVWGTIPVTAADQTRVESTVFSVSADRKTYESISDDLALSNAAFLASFGEVWTAPEVPR